MLKLGETVRKLIIQFKSLDYGVILFVLLLLFNSESSLFSRIFRTFTVY
jgi:hypothetical protein